MSDKDFDDLLDDENDADAQSVNQRDKRINAFLQQVDKRIKIAKARNKVDAKKRIAAIHWLGEAGEPKAIQTLVTLYKKDDTKGVKQASAYALGQFRALEDAMSDPETAEYAQELLSDIILKGHLGKQASPSPRLLKILAGVLTVTLLIWVGLFVVMGGTAQPPAVAQATAIPEDVPPIDVNADLVMLYRDLEADAETLRVQFLNITRDQAPDCSVSFNFPQPYVLPDTITSDNPLVISASMLEDARIQLEPLRNAYINACNAQRVIPRQEALTYSDNIAEVQRLLTSITGLSFDVVPETSEPEDVVIVEEETTPEPIAEVEPTPTLDPADYDTYIVELERLITDMNGQTRGHNTLLLQSWQAVGTETRITACNNLLPVPSLPADYALPDELVDEAPEALVDAITSYNLGMQLSRSSWRAFEDSCNTSTMNEVVALQTITAQTAQNAFNEADNQLSDLLFNRR